MRLLYEKVVILLHTFENSAFGASEFDIPIKDPKLDGHFVERTRRSSRESLIGVVKNAGARAVPPPQGAMLFGEKLSKNRKTKKNEKNIFWL